MRGGSHAQFSEWTTVELMADAHHARTSDKLRHLEHLVALERERLGREPVPPTGEQAPRERLVTRIEHLTRYPLALASLAWLGLLIALTTSRGGSVTIVVFFVLWASFLVEYALRLLLTPAPARYVRRRWIEPLAVLLPPLLTAHFVSIEHATEAFGKGARRVRDVLGHHALVRVLLGALLIMTIGAWIVDLSERHAASSNIHDLPTALWWAIVTVTTVGYGDHFPVSTAGRVVAVVMMLIGIGLIGTLTATVASVFVKDHTDQLTADATANHHLLAERLEEIAARLKDVEHRFGASDDDISALDRQADDLADHEDLS